MLRGYLIGGIKEQKEDQTGSDIGDKREGGMGFSQT